MSFPNQKSIVICKEDCNENFIYAKINIRAMQKAMQELKAGSFKLWIYFAKNQENYKFDLSAAECEKDWGIKPDSFHSAVNDLIDKGYLRNISGNTYAFVERGI